MIKLGGSSWAKKMVVLRTQFCGVWLFYDLFICGFYIRRCGYLDLESGFVGN